MYSFYNSLYLKVIAIAFISILLFNTGLQAQVIPINEDFSAYPPINTIVTRSVSVSANPTLPLTFQYVSPVSIPGPSTMFIGNLGDPNKFRYGNAFYFNAGLSGLIPGNGAVGTAEYRITFAPSADLTTPVGNFGLGYMYLCIGKGNVSQVVMQGYRGGVMVANDVIFLGDGSTSITTTGITYSGNDAFSGTNLFFGTNWQFLDEIRIHLPNGQYPVMIDDLNFNSPTNYAPTGLTTTSVTSVTGRTATINWTNISATADGVAVFMKAGNTGTASPVDYSSPTASAVFGSGSQIGSSGWYCVYKGKALSVDVTGLSQGTDYRVMAVAYNGATGWDTYGTGATTNITNLTTIAAPTIQASDVIVTPNYTDRRRVLISWVRGNGNRCAVFVRNETVTTGPAIPPVENDNYTYNAFTDSMSVTANGRVGSSGWYCVYNGASSGQGLPGAVSMNRITVASGQLFKVMVMEYNGAAGSETYNINTATLNPVQYLGGDAPATVTLPAENILSTSADVKATVDPRKGNVTGIVFSYGTSPTLATTLGTISTVTPSATSILGSAAATTVMTGITGLSPSTQYYYRAAATNNAGTYTSPILSFFTAPVISSVSSTVADGHYKAGAVIPVTVTFTSNVVVTGTPVLSLNTGGPVSYTSGSGTSVLTFNYTVGAGEDVADLDVLSLSGGTVKDIYGTNASLILPPAASFGLQKDIVIDTNVPVLSLVNIASDNSNTALAKTGNVITLNFTSNETILPQVVSVAGHIVTAVNTGGNNWTATYTMANGDADGTLAFNISFSDQAANAGLAVTATSNSSQVVFDGTVPVLNPVTIVSDNAIPTKAKVGNTITLHFTSSEAINAPAVTIAGQVVIAINTGGNNYTANYTMANSDAEGFIAFDIACSDLTGNAAAAVTSPSGITFDRTAPALNPVTIVSDNGFATQAKMGNTITLQFTSSETIGVPVVTIAGHVVNATNTGANNWSATYTITRNDAEGAVTFDIVYIDLAGNAAATYSSPSGITIDHTVPVLSQVAIGPSLAKVGSIITLNFTSSELIATPVVIIAGHVVNATNTSANNWSATYTMANSDAEGVVPFVIAFLDVAGNTGVTVTSATNGSSVTFDRTAPSVLSINRQSPLTPVSGAGSVVYRVTFSEFVKGVSTSAFVLGRTGAANGTIAVVSANEGTVIDVTVNNIVSGGTLRLDLTGTGILDQAGNAIAGNYSAGEQYTLNTSPVFTVSGPQTITLCSNASVAIQDLLQSRDDDNGQTLTWTIINNPTHGSISGLPFTANTNGANVIPANITYTPVANYAGADGFTVQVSDGYASATLIFQVTINVVTPAVVLAVTPGNKIPLSSPAVFTATATNGGAAPVYTFKVNGQNVQTGNLNTFSSSTLRNRDVVTCDLTGNAACASVPVVTSNSITMDVTQPVPLYLYPNPASSIVHVSSAKPMIKIIIANGQGKIVLFKYMADVMSADINVGGLAAGIYYVVIVDSNASKQKGTLVVVK